jgi:hypothetical protein
MALQMLKSFYSVPKIDLNAYSPDVPKDSFITKTLNKLKRLFSVFKTDTNAIIPDDSKIPYLKTPYKDVFEKMDIKDKDFLKEVFEKTKIEGSVDFADENMGKWPVIFLDFKDIIFYNSTSITIERIIKEITEKVIMPAFKEYEDLLFHRMSLHACDLKYGEITNDNYEKLISDYNLKAYKGMRDKINVL